MSQTPDRRRQPSWWLVEAHISSWPYNFNGTLLVGSSSRATSWSFTTVPLKRVGLVVDFVEVLRELKKALQFDSTDVSGVIEDLDLLLKDLLGKIEEKAKADYLEVGEGSADERLEKMVYGRFLDPEPRKAFFDVYKEIEALWEIPLSITGAS